MKSKFTGSVLGYIGYSLLISFVTLISFGIAYPFIFVVFLRWQLKHTYVEGKQLRFIGSGSSLFVNYIVWFLLTFITLGIYGLWVPVKFLRWKTENTVFEDDNPAIIAE